MDHTIRSVCPKCKTLMSITNISRNKLITHYHNNTSCHKCIELIYQRTISNDDKKCVLLVCNNNEKQIIFIGVQKYISYFNQLIMIDNERIVHTNDNPINLPDYYIKANKDYPGSFPMKNIIMCKLDYEPHTSITNKHVRLFSYVGYKKIIYGYIYRIHSIRYLFDECIDLSCAISMIIIEIALGNIFP